MKSIKNQYVALKEGKMTEAQFMRNVRMTLPEYISNVTLFKQAERILINKGIISEIKAESPLTINGKVVKTYTQNSDESYNVKYDEGGSETIMKSDKGWDDINTLRKNATNDSLNEGAGTLTIEKRKDGKYYWQYKFKSGKTEDWPAGFNTKADAQKDFMYRSKYIKESVNEVKDTSATGYYNQDGKEQYSKFNELDNMNAQEIMAGYVMEKQDNPDIDQKEAVKLVIKNLKKDQFYYTNYKLTGIRDLEPTEFTSTKRKPFFDEMEEVNKNGDNFVDEKNKMIVVKEAKIEDVKLLLSDETLKNSQIGDSNGGVSIIYNDYKKIPSEDLNKLRNSFIVDEDRLSDTGETEVYQYYLSDKMDEVMKPDSKLKLKELVRKMMKEMFDGRDNLTDINEGYYDDIAGYTSVSDNGTGFKDNDKVKSKSGQEGFVYDVLKSKEGKALIVVKFQKNGMTTISKYGEGFNDINDISK
jgi:hypothetical protein